MNLVVMNQTILLKIYINAKNYIKGDTSMQVEKSPI